MDEHQMKDAALRLALEALEKLDGVMKRSPDTDKAITAIKQALEQEKALQALHNENERLGLYKDAYGQPEPEPVAVVAGYYGGKCVILPINPSQIFNSNTALYTSPPKREPLTDEQIDALPFPPSGTATLRDFVRIIEAAHGIKE